VRPATRAYWVTRDTEADPLIHGIARALFNLQTAMPWPPVIPVREIGLDSAAVRRLPRSIPARGIPRKRHASGLSVLR
jgi:hypothetical protein